MSSTPVPPPRRAAVLGDPPAATATPNASPHDSGDGTAAEPAPVLAPVLAQLDADSARAAGMLFVNVVAEYFARAADRTADVSGGVPDAPTRSTALNRALRARYNASGPGWITGTDLGGRRILRVTITNPRTTPDDTRALLDGLAGVARTLG